MSHPNPQEELSGYSVAAGDRYKISIIIFMHDDNIAANKLLSDRKKKNNEFKLDYRLQIEESDRKNRRADYYKYCGVRDVDIRNAEGISGKTLLGNNPRGDYRLRLILNELLEHGMIKRTEVSFKKKRPSNYYTLTPDGEDFYVFIQDLLAKPIGKLLFCLKDQDKGYERTGGTIKLEKISELVETK